MIKYPRLKCEDKQNTVVCSLDIKKMKKLRKTGLSYTKIGQSLKIPLNIVLYHISLSECSPESRERKKKYVREYNRRRYTTDPEYRRKMLDSINESQARRRKDPTYSKWEQQNSHRNHKVWVENLKKIYPNWNFLCVIGSHATTNRKIKCLNIYKKCKCPCHEK